MKNNIFGHSLLTIALAAFILYLEPYLSPVFGLELLFKCLKELHINILDKKCCILSTQTLVKHNSNESKNRSFNHEFTFYEVTSENN